MSPTPGAAAAAAAESAGMERPLVFLSLSLRNSHSLFVSETVAS